MKYKVVDEKGLIVNVVDADTPSEACNIVAEILGYPNLAGFEFATDEELTAIAD